MVERKFKEGYSAPELKELEKELDKKAEEWYSLDEVTDSARKKRLWNDIFTLAVCRYNIPDKKKDKIILIISTTIKHSLLNNN